MRLFGIALFVVSGCAVASLAYGQPDWQFTRLDDEGVFVSAEESPFTEFDSGSDMDQAAGDILVNVATTASASDDSGFAQSTSMAQAMNLTPVGATTFVPTVDTTVSNSSIASVSLPGSFTELRGTRAPSVSAGSNVPSMGGVTASSDGSFLLDGMPTSGFLHGSMYLFGLITGTETASGLASANFIGDGFVQAKVEGFFVEAGYDDSIELWGVDVSLPGVTESFFTPSLNHYFTFSIPITLPRTIDIDATSSTEVRSVAVAQGFEAASATAQGLVNLSASAWATYTPTIVPPPNGDFDGDGDVDGGDFLTWQRGFGESLGATLSQGDADHDGNVNSVDLALWEGNFGTTGFSAISATLAVPEPTTSVMALAAFLLVFSRIRFRGDF